MTRKRFVIDTGYLVEIYKVPGFGDQKSWSAIHARLVDATKRGDRLLLPAVVIFETANHIARVRDGNLRRALALKLRGDVVQSLKGNDPFIVVPHLDSNALVTLMDRFAEEFATEGLSLTDSSIVTEARRQHDEHPGKLVHIWTRDRATKAREPNPEEDPFI